MHFDISLSGASTQTHILYIQGYIYTYTHICMYVLEWGYDEGYSSISNWSAITFIVEMVDIRFEGIANLRQR